MRYRGREIDPISLWENYCEFPSNLEVDGMYSPKVKCPNPDHDTEKRHFQVNVQDGLVHCFAYCGISGTFEHALAVIHGFYDKHKVEEAEGSEKKRRVTAARKESRKLILKHQRTGQISRIGSVRKKSRNSRRSNELVPAGSLVFDTYIPQVGLEYLAARGITASSISAWNVGWLAEEQRIAIPALDERGVLRFLIKRAVLPKQQPKYLYTEGYPKTSLLFGACALDLGMVRSQGLILVEGSIGTILNHQDGLRNTTAILGTGISEEQRRIVARIKPPKIYLMFDKDSAGVRNIEVAAMRLRKYPLYVVKFPKGVSDWDEADVRQKERQISRAVPCWRFLHDNGLSVKQPRKDYSFG